MNFGIDRLLSEPGLRTPLEGKRVALVAHPASVTRNLEHSLDALIDEGLLLQHRWGQPEDVGKAVVMLARGELAYSTGQVIDVDGSLTKTVL